MEVPLGTNLLGSLIEYIRTSEPQVSKQDTGTRGGVGVHDLPLPEYEKWECIPPQYLSSWPVIKCLQKQKEKSWSLTKHNYSFLYYFWGFHLPPPDVWLMVSALTCMFFSERTWRTQREKHGKSTDPVEHIAAKQSFWNNNHSNEWASFCTVISWKHKSNTWETIACVCGGVFVAKTTLFTWQKHQHPHSCELNSHPALDPLCKPCVAIKVPLYGHLSCHTYSYACTWAIPVSFSLLLKLFFHYSI